VLDMGKPVKIVDLARQMIEMSGLKPNDDIRIEFTGLRPGEKLFEELTQKGENFAPTTHPKICRFVSQPADLTQLRRNTGTISHQPSPTATGPSQAGSARGDSRIYALLAAARKPPANTEPE